MGGNDAPGRMATSVSAELGDVPPVPFHKRRWFHIALQIFGLVLIVYAMVFADVWMRGKEAFQKADEFEQVAGRLMKSEEAKMTSAEKEKLLAEITENWKMAYVWYQTVYEQFPLRGPGSWWKGLSLPESPWVEQAALKAKEARQMWKNYLIKRKIPFEDYMLD